MTEYFKSQVHDEINAIVGPMASLLGQRLAYLAMMVPDGGQIVEIGSLRGKSSCFMGAAIKEDEGKVKLHCVDLWDIGGQKRVHSGKEVRLTFTANINRFGLQDIIEPHMAESVAFSRKWHGSIDLLFIDGSHAYKDCLADYQAWHKFLKPGGWIAFHDYQKECPGVMRVIDETVTPGGLFENIQITREYELTQPGKPGQVLWTAQRKTK